LDKIKARSEIEGLVQKFKDHQDIYESSEYLERQLQTDFLDDFFKILGWDLTNKANLAPYLREVLVEKGDTRGRPDYTFRVNGADRFFVEAKSPSRGTEKPEDIFQAKSYGYSTKSVKLAILTDFKTLKVFDTGIKPDIKKPTQGLLYETDLSKIAKDDFDQIWVFSHDEVHNGSLEQLLLKYPALKRLRIPVDVTFLEQLTIWREGLAKEIYKKNPCISVRSLNDVVQRLLDRLIFIRLLEDREIIKSRHLKDIADNWRESRHRDIQPELNALFKKLNNDFNGEIFKPHDCETKKYDSKIMADIIEELYPPKSAYDFSVIGVELLGIIYEKYLGKTIRLTDKRLKVEEKPEVRHAGGVYYTPKWVVDYIVDNTVGSLIDGKTPEQIAKLRVLDPACGSGSFLIGTLSKLFDYHLVYYTEHRREAKEGTLFPKVIRVQNTEPRLSIYVKAEILKNNIFGVDLDPQAVEITMMSLYIKVLEGERALPENKELLPSLTNNIRCGNSLIGFDFVSQQTLLQDADREKTNPFEWRSNKTGFGNIIGVKGGFHAIVGNPPYIRIQTMKEWAPKEVEYFSSKYETAETGNYDIYVIFVEKVMQLLDEEGMMGFILPNKFFQAEYGKNLRRLLSDNNYVRDIVNFTDQQVFEQATTYTNLLFLNKVIKKNFKYAEIKKLDNPINQLSIIKRNSVYNNNTMYVEEIPVSNISEAPWVFGKAEETDLINKLRSIRPVLSDVCDKIFQGIITGSDKVFVLIFEKQIDSQTFSLFSPALNDTVEIESKLLRPLLKGSLDIRRYRIVSPKKFVIFPYSITNSKAQLIPFEELETKFQKCANYLKLNKKTLENREHSKWKGPDWYAFSRNQNLVQCGTTKILTPSIAKKASFVYDSQGNYYFLGSGGGGGGGYGLSLKKTYGIDPFYLIGLLNSKLLDYLVKKVSTRFSGGFFAYNKQYIESLPIIIPDINQIEGVNKIAVLAKKISDISEKMSGASDSSSIELLSRELTVYEEQIDELVYDLYKLNEAEKQLIRET